MLAGLIDELVDPEVGHDEVAVAEGRALRLTGQGDQLTHLMHVGRDIADVEFHALLGEELVWPEDLRLANEEVASLQLRVFC